MYTLALANAFSNLLSNTPWLVFLSAFLATFIGSVMADEQSDRLRNSSFGAVAGTAVGGLAALLTKQQELLLVGMFGSACGAIIGWLIYLILSFVASSPQGRRLLDYHISGLKGVRERLDFSEKERLIRSLSAWSANFSRMVSSERNRILQNAQRQEANHWIEVILKYWLTSVVDVFNLVFDALAEKREYRSRVTIIVFGKDEQSKILGKHWINYSGRLPAHKQAPFPEKSIAYQVVSGAKESPFFITVETANKTAQDRGEGSKQEQAGSYSTFFSFRLNDRAVLSLDWPGQLDEDDPYVNIAKDLFYLQIVPAIADLLSLWQGNIEQTVNLDPLASCVSGNGFSPESRLNSIAQEAAESVVI